MFADQRPLSTLLRGSARVHRHLDWRSPLDWIGSPPFLIAERAGQTEAALACPPDPPQVAWVRLFLDLGNLPAAETWALLWQSARGMLAAQGKFVAAAIVLQDWCRDLLADSGFASRQAIVMLERQEGSPLDSPPPAGVSIRPMMPGDLPAVAGVDAVAFAPLWQNTLSALERAYPQAVLATVAEKDGSLVGYQISTSNPYGAHLARLAVRPDTQGRGIGYALTADLVRQLSRRGVGRLTVNTQSDNLASLNLYRQAGFRLTGEQYPVYVFEA